MDNDNTNSNSEHGKSRRGFVKKSSAIAGISVLPASNVWGTCNVSGVSGGSQMANSSCVVGNIHGGFWPNHWHQLTKDDPTEDDYQRLNIMLSGIWKNTLMPDGHTRKLVHYYPKVKALIESRGMDITGALSVPYHLNPYAVVRNTLIHGREKHLAALYLNHFFGFAEVEPHFTGHDGRKDLMEHVWNSYTVGDRDQVLAALQRSYVTKEISEQHLIDLLDANGIPIM